jgi:hypothetical protein
MDPLMTQVPIEIENQYESIFNLETESLWVGKMMKTH